MDAEYDFDGGIEMYESRNKRGNAEAQKARERSRQVRRLGRSGLQRAGGTLSAPGSRCGRGAAHAAPQGRVLSLLTGVRRAAPGGRGGGLPAVPQQ